MHDKSAAKLRTLGLLHLIFLIGCLAVQGQVTSSNSRAIHVKFKEQFVPHSAIPQQSMRTGVSRMDETSKTHNVISVQRIFPDAGIYEEAHKAYGLHLWYEIKLSKQSRVDKAIVAYKNLNYFHEVEESRDYTSNSENTEAAPILPAGTNDPYFLHQWHFNNYGQTGGKLGADINLLKAWKIETGSPNVIVAVIDGGIDLKHPDLAGALWTNNNEIPNNGIDDDLNGYVDDIHGYGFGDGIPTIFPDFHATHVAGTIGAVSNNGIGVAGIAGGSGSGDGVRLMSCAGFGQFRTGGFEAAMVYAADNGAVISQNSWGGGSNAIEAAIDYFVQRAGYDNTSAKFNLNIQTGPMAGGLVIFAAGNSNTSNPVNGYPASYKNAIAVASTDHRDVKSRFSNFGSWVDISAPGTNVFSTYGNEYYSSLNGTSMACPHVSGVAALVVSNLQRIGLKPKEVWDRIRLSAHSIATENPGMNGLLGFGRLNALLSLRDYDAIPPAAISDLRVSEVRSSSIVFKWTATGESGITGRAAGYEIRYSTSPINVTNFNSASLVADPPVPPQTGQEVTFEFNNLLSATTYFLALKSRDAFDNVSEVSNIVSVRTLKPATPQLITTELTEQLYTGGIIARNILVKNAGEEELVMRMRVPDVALAPVGLPTGSKGRLFAINTLKNTIDELNSMTGLILRSVPLPEPSTKNSEGLAFDGINLYYGRFKKIHKLDAETGQVLRSFTVNGISQIDGLAWSGRYLYISDRSQGIYEVDSDTGVVVRRFDLYGKGLTFAGRNSSFFIVDSGGLIEISASTGLFLRSINIDIGGNSNGLVYSDSEGLIFVSNGSTSIAAVNPQTGIVVRTLSYYPTTALAADEFKPSWLTNQEQIVTIAPGATASFPVTFVATELPAGQWMGKVEVIPLSIISNPLEVPVTLTVTTATDIETLTELNFGSQYKGLSIDSIFSIENRGFSDLVITDIHSDDPRVTTSLSSATVAPGQKIPLTVVINSAQVGTIDAKITIISNDPDESMILMPVAAQILLSPAIEVNPPALNVSMVQGESKAVNFTAKNTGESDLHWKVNFAGSELSNFGESNPSSTIGEFTLKASSPESLTSLSYDPQFGHIYAKSSFGNSFYRYDPMLDSWANIGFTPGNFYGQGAYQAGKIYYGYYGGSQLSVYTIQTNSWATIPLPSETNNGSITSDGQYLYLTIGLGFYRYDPVQNEWLQLANPPRNMGGLSHQGGVIYAHENSEITGSGNNPFFKYFIDSDTWLRSDDISGKLNFGGAIDPSKRRYFVIGAPFALPESQIQMSILDLNEGSWERKVIPFEAEYSSMIFVGRPDFSGIYFSQGGRTGFARYETAPASDWISVTPSQGVLSPGETQTFEVKLNSAGLDGGTFLRNLKVFSNNPKIDGTVPLTVTVQGAPDISMSKTNFDVGDTEIGRGWGTPLIVKNTGTATLVVANITSDRPDFTFTRSSFTLPTGESIFLSASFNPTVTGPQTGKITFHNNDPDEGEIQFIMKGNGVPPPIPSISQAFLSADLLSGAKSIQKLAISNTGGSNMSTNVYSISIEPYTASWLKRSLYEDVAPGETNEVDIIIDAAGFGEGTYTAKIQLWYWGEIKIEVPVTMTVTDATDIFTSRNKLNYGEQYISNSYDSAIQIRNDGVLPLSIISINSDNPVFTILSSQAPLNLQPGESISATIRFTPTTLGTHDGNIIFVSNDPDEGTYNISLSGKGIGPPVIATNILQLTASALTDEIQTQSLTLNNLGGSSLKWRIVGQSNFFPSSINGEKQLEESLSAGDFTSLGLTPTEFISPVFDPNSGKIYAQAFMGNYLYKFNPINEQWSTEVELPYELGYHESGGAVFLNSIMYSVYHTNSSKIGVYNSIIRNWSTIPNMLGEGTDAITTDGKLLYLAGKSSFKSLDPKTGIWLDLPLPTISLGEKGGLSYYDGMIYAHDGIGKGFARYIISTGSWENLAPVPDNTVLGSAIDPVRERYYAYGKNGSSNLYEYDINAEAWNVINISLFEVNDGGIVYIPNSGAEGIYFIQGSSGRGFARYQPLDYFAWLRLGPLTGEITALKSQTIGVNYNAYGLNTGTYRGSVNVISNDPNSSLMVIPVEFNVTNPGPNIKVPASIFDTIQPSVPYTIQFKIENKGLNTLNWSLTKPLPVGLIASKLSGSISGSNFENISITFDPTSTIASVFDYQLEISSNDAFKPNVSIAIKFIKTTNITNRVPFVLSEIQSINLTSKPTEISLISSFSDPDGDPLTFSAKSSIPEVASVNISGSLLTVNPIASGISVITVKATDIFNASATTAFATTVSLVVTGLEEVETKDHLIARPNPFEKNVTVYYHTRDTGLGEIIVHDITGKVVWRGEQYHEINGKNEIEIDGFQLAPGIYNCTLLRNGDRIHSIRLLRN